MSGNCTCQCVVSRGTIHRSGCGGYTERLEHPDCGIGRGYADTVEDVSRRQSLGDPSFNSALALSPESPEFLLRPEWSHIVDSAASLGSRTFLHSPDVRPAATPCSTDTDSAKIPGLDPITDGAWRQTEMVRHLCDCEIVGIVLLHTSQMDPGAMAFKFLAALSLVDDGTLLKPKEPGLGKPGLWETCFTAPSYGLSALFVSGGSDRCDLAGSPASRLACRCRRRLPYIPDRQLVCGDRATLPRSQER